MGIRAHVEDVKRSGATLDSTRFSNFELSEVEGTLQAMEDWFGRRTADDDGRAFTIQFEGVLYPDDLMIIDARPTVYDFRGAEHHLSVTSLERDEPGAFQERDIVRLLRRAFLGQSIFLNPVRTETGTELADILCLTDEVLVLVQAKDSPNNEATLRRIIDRKRGVIRAHIEKGARQLQGDLSYVTTREKLALSTSSGAHTLAVAGRLICGLVVVREMFDYDYGPCSVPVLAVARTCGAPCVLLDYAAMHVMTQHLRSPTRLLNGFYQLFESAWENGEYPKPRFIGPPGNAVE